MEGLAQVSVSVPVSWVGGSLPTGLPIFLLDSLQIQPAQIKSF